MAKIQKKKAIPEKNLSPVILGNSFPWRLQNLVACKGGFVTIMSELDMDNCCHWEKPSCVFATPSLGPRVDLPCRVQSAQGAECAGMLPWRSSSSVNSVGGKNDANTQTVWTAMTRIYTSVSIASAGFIDALIWQNCRLPKLEAVARYFFWRRLGAVVSWRSVLN